MLEMVSSRPQLPPEQQWFQIFDIVFPGEPRPASIVLVDCFFIKELSFKFLTECFGSQGRPKIMETLLGAVETNFGEDLRPFDRGALAKRFEAIFNTLIHESMYNGNSSESVAVTSTVHAFKVVWHNSRTHRDQCS